MTPDVRATRTQALIQLKGLAPLTLLIVALALLAPVAVQPAGIVYPARGDFTDLTITHWPNIAFAVDTLHATGRLPLWRPLIMSGTPFAANPLSGLDYFPHLIFLVLPLALGFNLVWLGHIWLAGCGMYALLREIEIGPWGALAGALAWMAAPRFFAHMGAGHVSLVESMAWLPLAVLVTRRAMARRKVGSAALVGCVWAVQVLADPRAGFYSIGLCLTYILFTQAPQWRVMKWQTISCAPAVRALLVSLLALAVLSAALWVPLAEFVRYSSRNLSLAEAGAWSLPLRHLVGLVLVDWGSYPEWSVYLGILPLLLAVVGLRAQFLSRSVRAWLGAVALGACLLALGTYGPVFPILFRLVPGMTFLRVPARAWFLVAFAVAVLAGTGTHEIARQLTAREVKRLPRALVLLGFAAAVFGLFFGLGGFALLLGNSQAANARLSLLHLGLALPISVGFVLLGAADKLSARQWAIGCVAIIIATLLPVDLGLYRIVSRDQAFSERAGLANWLAGQPGVFRVYSPSYSLPQHIAYQAGIELADGVDPLQIAAYARLMQEAGGTHLPGYSVTIPPFPDKSDVRTAWQNARPDAALLGRLNVRYVAADFAIQSPGLVERARIGESFIYENTQALPRAYLEDGAPARILARLPERLLIEAGGPGMLVVAQPYYPGWRAYVDGRETAVRANGEGLAAISLDRGPHQIEFVFDPWLVKASAATSLLGWLALGIWGAAQRWMRWKHAGK